MSDVAAAPPEPPRAHARVVYLGPVAPHWEIHSDFGDRQIIDEFRGRVLARLVLLPPHDPQFRRNRERVIRDAERENILLDWDLGLPEDDEHRADRPCRSPSGHRVASVGSVRSAAMADVDDTRSRASSTTPADAPRYLNRELSWLDFNDRVLALAADDAVPLLERAKFLAIFSQNLDEFFQVRVAGLKDQVAAGLGVASPDGRTPGQQLLEVRERVEALVERQQRLFLDEVVPALADERHPAVALGRARRRRREVPRRDVRAAHLPGAHAARRRPRPPVPVHLEPVAQPRGARCATRSPASGASPGSRCPTCCRGSW